MENKKRLIDANALKERAIRVVTVKELGSKNHCYIKAVGTHEIDKAPTVDAVEVVRCKDCKHYDNSEGIFWCHMNSKFYPGGMDWHSFPEDGFCCYGERRTIHEES